VANSRSEEKTNYYHRVYSAHAANGGTKRSSEDRKRIVC